MRVVLVDFRDEKEHGRKEEAESKSCDQGVGGQVDISKFCWVIPRLEYLLRKLVKLWYVWRDRFAEGRAIDQVGDHGQSHCAGPEQSGWFNRSYRDRYEELEWVSLEQNELASR